MISQNVQEYYNITNTNKDEIDKNLTEQLIQNAFNCVKVSLSFSQRLKFNCLNIISIFISLLI